MRLPFFSTITCRRPSRFWCAVVVVPVLLWLGRASAGPPDLNQRTHRHWTHRGGLPNNSIQGISQDPRGFMWFAGQEGPIRYDGRFMRWMGRDGEAPFPRDDMRCLIRDETGVLWWGTQTQGVWRYAAGVSEPLPGMEALAGRPVTALLRDRSGTLWIGSDGRGLLRWRDGRAEVVTTVAMKNIQALAEGPDQSLWIGGDDGLRRLRGDRVETVRYEAFQPSTVNALLVGDAGLWVADQNHGLWVIEEDRPRAVFFDQRRRDRNSILALLQDRDGVLWFGTSAGLGLVDQRETAFFEVLHGVPLNRVNVLFEDRDGSVWLSNFGSGVHRLRTGLFRTYRRDDTQRDEITWSVFEDRGVLWTVRDVGILGWYDLDTGAALPLPPALKKQRVLSLGRMADGTVLLGTFRGLFRWDGMELTKMEAVDADGKAGLESYVLPMFVDSRDRVWFGQAEGLGLVDGSAYRLFRDQGLAAATVQSFAEDGLGRIWLGTDKGLIVVDGEAQRQYDPEASGIDGDDVLSVAVDSADRVIFSVTGAGLWVLEQEQVRPVEIPELRGLSLFAIQTDAEGNLWLPSNTGIFLVPSAVYREALSAPVAANRIYQFGQTDGMRRAECNHGGSPTAFRTTDGRLTFATTGGAALADPAALDAYVARWTAPTVLLEQLTVDGRATPPTGTPVLDYRFEQMALSFSVIDFHAPRALRVFARLAGHDREWDAVNDLSRLDYTQIPPGDYQFEVRAFGRGSLVATETLAIKVRAPWFAVRNLPLWLSLLLVVVGLVAGAIFRRRWHKAAAVRLAKHQKLYLEVEESRTRLTRAQHQIEEVGGQASQNEVVTHLLHNMGNVLNSVSVSAGVIEKLLRGTGVYALLTRIAALFPKQPDQQQAFFGGSPRARRLPETYCQIADLLDEHQQGLLDEVANLQVQSAHMKELVLSVSEIQKPIFELFDINILIEDAVKMQSHTLRKFGIEVEHDLMPLDPVRAKKSQILQILVNLVKNACEAMVENDEHHHRLIAIHSYRQDAYALVSVTDSGPGIAPEHLPMLFGHGFTTKVGGHGFGLHFCRKVMREMGGDLTVEGSSDLGGASFKLWIRCD